MVIMRIDWVTGGGLFFQFYFILFGFGVLSIFIDHFFHI